MHAAVNRRQFLQGGAVVSSGLVLGVALGGCDSKPAPASIDPAQNTPINAWLQIDTDGAVRFLCDRAEMGQGVYTSLPMLLAEELGVDVGTIAVEFAPAGAAYINNLLGTQITGGSTSIRDAWVKLRTAGAQAREMLIAAAAAEWDVATTGIRTENGAVISPRGKRLSFGAVAAAAAKMPVPKEVTLRAKDNYRVIGRERLRLDTPAKVDGSARFGIDVKLDGMLYGALAQPPVLGGKLRSFDASKAKAMPGVSDVIATSSGVVVLATSWWRARRARDAVSIQWDPGANAALNNAVIMAGLRKASADAGKLPRNDGDALASLAAAPKNGERVLRADYELPLLAHATLEPQTCTAVVTADSCDLYVPTQVQQIAQGAAAAAAGLKPEQVRVHTTFLGGGFGRRLEVDFIPAAVEAAKAAGKPVKILWTREDDMTHDAYRPPAFNQVSAALAKDGKPSAWHIHLTSPSMTARMFPSDDPNVIDPFAIEAAVNYPYDVPNVRVSYQQHEIGINVGYWRSVSHALNCFVAESFMDELAAAAGQDPLAYRLSLLAKQPRYAAVLKAAAREANYGVLDKGHHHGIALMEGYGTYMAQVADVSLENGKLRVHQIFCAVDCGTAVNPNNIIAQVESSTLFGLSAALWGQIDIAGGRVQQSNFDRYRILRLPEIPRIVTYIVDSDETPGGVGEPATALVAPAICNALYRATGKRVRSLPLARLGFA
jgi:isoquinoline 1-oxidoreductase beta subunit